MAQLSLYIDDLTAVRLNTAAKKNNCSVSKYVVSLIIDNLTDNEEQNKKQQLKQLCGTIDDPTFVIPVDISWDKKIARRFDI